MPYLPKKIEIENVDAESSPSAKQSQGKPLSTTGDFKFEEDIYSTLLSSTSVNLDTADKMRSFLNFEFQTRYNARETTGMMTSFVVDREKTNNREEDEESDD